jgi:pimeloyl-ACP methyl ester carboxylesterase
MRRIFIALAIFAAILFLVVVPVAFSYLLTHAGTQPRELKIALTPDSLGVPYREVQFVASDGTVLSGWYLPKQNSPAIIIYAHGIFRSRQEMLERAAALWQRGYAGLLIDLRRHGKSAGQLSGIGYLERLDVAGAAKFIRDSLQVDTPIVGFGVSMGAAATLLAAAQTPELSALIIDSSFLSFESTVAHHFKLYFGLPRFPVADALMALVRWKVGFRNEDFDMRRALEKIGDRPMLFITGEKDVRMPIETARELAAAAQTQRKTLVVIPQATHGAAYRTNPKMYVQAVMDFLSALVFSDAKESL